MFYTPKENSQIAVFGAVFYIKSMHFIDFEKCYPALNVMFEDQKVHTLFPFTEEADTGTMWKINQKQRFVFSANAFKVSKRYKMVIDLISPNDAQPLATIAYDLSPFIVDAIGAHGSSPTVNVKSVMKDLTRTREVMEIEFDLHVVYFNHCIKRPTVYGDVGPLPYEETLYMRNDSDPFNQELDPLAQSTNLRNVENKSKKLIRAQTYVF